MPERRIVTLERLEIHGPGKDRWFVRPRSRHGGWVWFDPEQVPFVDAAVAEFELERIKGGWKVLRHVETRS